MRAALPSLRPRKALPSPARPARPAYRAPILVVLLTGVLLLVGLAAPLSAQATAPVGDPGAPSGPQGESARRARAEVVLRLAAQDDEALLFSSALPGYDEGRALDPGSPLAPRAEARAAILRAHAEGDFAPFAELERVRRDAALASDGRSIDALVRHAESFPPGLVRVEVWVLAAEAYAHRLGRPGDADPLLVRVVTDPRADRVATQKAARDLVGLRVARRDLGAAEEAVRIAGDRADPSLAQDVRRWVRRRALHSTAIAVLLGIVLLAGRASVLAWRRGRGQHVRRAVARTWRLALGYGAYVAMGGALLASGYEQGTSAPFLWFGAVLIPLVLVARAWGEAGGPSPPARVGRAIVCAAGALGSAFLVLEAIDVAFLDGMGL